MGKPNFSFEKRYLKKGYRLVVGVDEVGRGAFAGPVAAGACALKIKNHPDQIGTKIKNKFDSVSAGQIGIVSKLGIDDSKKLAALKREKLAKEIKKYFYWGIGERSVGEINRFGIVKATERAMRRAVKQVIKKLSNWEIKGRDEKISNPNYSITQLPNYFLLVDAFYVKYIPGVGLKNQKAIVHGDQRSISIAAASILAKVYRDTLMQKLALRYRKYHWDKNKGYGTKEHREAIRRYGATKLHRRKFVESWLL